LLIIIYGIQGENILESGYGGGEVQKGTLHEYFILIFLLIVLVFPNKSLFGKVVVYSLFILFCFKTILYGGRIEVLQISLLFLYLMWILSGRIKKALVYVGAILVIYVGEVFGSIRSNPSEFLQGN